MRRSFNAATLTRFRDMSSEHALAMLAIDVKADPTYVPLKAAQSRRWQARTNCGDFEILTTGPKWYDTRAKMGGGGAIDLAMHVLGLSFVDAVKLLSERSRLRGPDHS